MQINLVARGDDHVNNTAIQVLLYEALGYPVPAFAHLPMILGADKTRLSKRHGATSVTAYRDMGFLPEAVVNYLVRLGWSHGDQEISPWRSWWSTSASTTWATPPASSTRRRCSG